MFDKSSIALFNFFVVFVYGVSAVLALPSFEFSLFLLYLLYLFFSTFILINLPSFSPIKPFVSSSNWLNIFFELFFLIPFLIAFLCFVLSKVLPLDLWLAPGVIKYSAYENRSGIMFAFVQVYGLVFSALFKSRFNIVLFNFLGFVVVLLVLGRNPALIYGLTIVHFFFRGKFQLVVVLFLGLVFATLVNSARAVGFGLEDVIDHLSRHGYLNYIINSSELNLGARTFLAVQGTVLDRTIDGVQAWYPLTPFFSLQPLSLFFDDSFLQGFARHVADVYPTTGGMPIFIEGYYLYFGVFGGIVHGSFYILLVYFIHLLFRRYLPSYVLSINFLYVLINMVRIDSVTSINFTVNHLVVCLFIFFIFRALNLDYSKT